ncbi:MAG: sigma-70 family RNA polymerase sigma factor [Planctomycetes bacterium]|nr:sigma-70 family RNA polymerase sigma factor [Planctomycetota bacterium]
MQTPPGEENDEALVARCQFGDFSAFEILYSRYQRPILAYIYQITRNYDESACIAQDVFMRVFEHVDRFDTQRRFTTWFYTIARNAAIDYLQSRNRKVMVAFTDLDRDDENDTVANNTGAVGVSIESALAQGESNRHLGKALAELPQIYREIIELIIFQEKDYEEASAILGGVSLGTLRSRMFHALKRLRESLTAAGGAEGLDLL